MAARAPLAVFPGSFDPVTNGHLDLIGRAQQLFGRVVVAVVRNPAKTPLFSVDERVALLRDSLPATDEIEIVPFDGGLLVDFLRDRAATVVVRGLRGVSDFDYEQQMALMNRHLAPTIDTVFLMPSARFAYTSSTLVRQVGLGGGDLGLLVPPAVARALHARRATASRE